MECGEIGFEIDERSPEAFKFVHGHHKPSQLDGHSIAGDRVNSGRRRRWIDHPQLYSSGKTSNRKAVFKTTSTKAQFSMLNRLSSAHTFRNVYICPRCIYFTPSRSFSRLAALQSGHNRWSKIRHDKTKNDMGKNKQRNLLANEIATSSKCMVN